jgi:hypothetical protein
MSYQYGQTTLKPQAAKTSDEIRVELENLNRLRAAILAETEAKAKELARIRAARLRLQPIATYAPTPEALAYREIFGHIIAQQPAPLHGGVRGLRMATAEAARHDERKRIGAAA